MSQQLVVVVAAVGGGAAVVVAMEVAATGAVVSVLPLQAEATSNTVTTTAYFLTT